MKASDLVPGGVLRGALFPEPVELLVASKFGDKWKLIVSGVHSNKTYQPVVDESQLEMLEVNPALEPFDGDARKFRLGIEAMRLGLAYEYDPYFSLSIARVDPLPHQLEAVYEYFLKLPRIRFLLADDPGAGKTVMAGLLVKELKARGLVKRVLIVTPASLTFQWQREMKDKFREQFTVIRSDVLRANYGMNPWQEHDQVVASVSWVSKVEDARDSLLRSRWDLVIVDEAHKMSAYSADRETLAYKLGKALSGMTDHFLLMTATPHKGDPENFSLFLRLLDPDVYADVSSLEQAMANREAPFYLRRVKEALVTFPNPDTGEVKSLFTKRIVRTAKFEINNEELDFYDALTRYVQEQSIRAAETDSPQARAVGFTMAMLQRRFASSLYAARRTLERMKERREQILKDPEAYRCEQINRRIPEGFEDLEEEQQQEIIDQIEEVVLNPDPAVLRQEIHELGKLIDQARVLEARDVETKLTALKELLTERGIFSDPKMKLLLFTEHKDTLDYLAGDGKDGRPLGKLRDWGLSITTIHGAMKVGDRDTPNSRIFAEREFKESCQVMVATEAAGEGINLQFCWLMVNYDIPWNPVRLEQRMGRIHRYGQEKDCLIFNFVACNTTEGRVLQKLFDRISAIEEDLDPDRTGKIFNVLGDVFPSNLLERMLRDMYARNQTEQVILDRIVRDIDTTRFSEITQSTLEGLAKRELNLSAVIGKTAEAKERRLVPEVIEDFFVEAAADAGMRVSPHRGKSHVYRIGRVPRQLLTRGEELEPRFGRLGQEYQDVIFNKELLKKDASSEWVTPGHPLFEALRAETEATTNGALSRGAVFHDLHRSSPSRLDVFTANIRDGDAHILNRRLFVLQTEMDGTVSVHNPTIFHEIVPAGAPVPVPDGTHLPGKDRLQEILLEKSLAQFLSEVRRERVRETEVVEKHVETSLNTILNRENLTLAELVTQREAGSEEQGLDGRIKQAENRIEENHRRLERRREELARQRECAVSDIRHIGRAWVLPHPDRNTPVGAAMRRDEEVERTAVRFATEALEAEGFVVESVESENRGFDLIARKFHPEDPKTAISMRFVEVKGRAISGEVALTYNEYKTAERLKEDYWLYVVFHCATEPSLNIIRNPSRLDWQAIVKVEHYRLNLESPNTPTLREDPPAYGSQNPTLP
jgi:superfamily II DNA or RNA helicase